MMYVCDIQMFIYSIYIYAVVQSCHMIWTPMPTVKSQAFPAQRWNLPLPRLRRLGVYPLHLEDHPMTCKWFITTVIVSLLTGVVPLPNGLSIAYKWGEY